MPRYTYTAQTESGQYSMEEVVNCLLRGQVLEVQEAFSTGWKGHKATTHGIRYGPSAPVYYRGTEAECEAELMRILAKANQHGEI